MRYRVVIDPGHGGADPGRVVGTAKEAAIALRVSKMLADELAERDVLCTLTRWDDVFVELQDRSAKSNAGNADVFVSVHCNASGNAKASGAQSFYCKGQKDGEAFARLCQQALETIMPPTDRSGALPDQSIHTGHTRAAKAYFDSLPASLSWREKIDRTEARFGAATYRRLHVLRRTKATAVLLELGFLTNDADRAKLTNPEMQRAFASAVADAVVRWLEERDGVA